MAELVDATDSKSVSSRSAGSSPALGTTLNSSNQAFMLDIYLEKEFALTLSLLSKKEMYSVIMVYNYLDFGLIYCI